MVACMTNTDWTPMDKLLSFKSTLAPQGRLRASINMGNRVLTGTDSNGKPVGVSIDIARELARRLGVDAELVVFDTAGMSVDAVKNEAADIGFFAIDPARSEGIAFTAPYVLIEGAYLVRNDSPLQDNASVDRAGTSVAVGKASAYDLFLTRELKHATIVRAPNSQVVVDTFMDDALDVAAGVRQQLELDAARISGLRFLTGSFMTIRQAMGLPAGRGTEAAGALRAFVEDIKASGLVAEAMARHGIEGASVAPAEDIQRDS